MKEMLISLLLDAQRNYNHTDLKVIREIESYFNFNLINNENIVCFSKLIVDESKNYGPISLRVEDTNRNIIFEHLGKGERNIEFAKKKANVVFKSKHVSFYPLIMYAIGFEDISYFENDELLPVAGGFPILENNKLKYVLGVSGLHDGKDFHVVIDALEKYLKTKIPEFKGYLV